MLIGTIEKLERYSLMLKVRNDFRGADGSFEFEHIKVVLSDFFDVTCVYKVGDLVGIKGIIECDSTKTVRLRAHKIISMNGGK
jgi:hypothetical protein